MSDDIDIAEIDSIREVVQSSEDSDEIYDFSEVAERFRDGGELADSEIDEIADIAISAIRRILLFFDAEDAAINEYEGPDGELILDVSGADLAVLIGRHGKTLESLQTIISLIVSRRLGFRYPIEVDVESYKSRRRQKIESIAISAATRAIQQDREVKLKPMSAYERRIVHMVLRNNSSVSTESEGRDPNRYVAIKPSQE